MTEYYRAAVALHHAAGIPLHEAEALLKGTGIEPLSDEYDFDAV